VTTPHRTFGRDELVSKDDDRDDVAETMRRQRPVDEVQNPVGGRDVQPVEVEPERLEVLDHQPGPLDLRHELVPPRRS